MFNYFPSAKFIYMRKLLLFSFLIFLIQSCWYTGVEHERYVSNYKPITQPRAEFEQTIRIMDIRPVLNSGKIYVKDDLIYLNEKGEGFHIIDNSDPEDPKPVAFLSIPLATDLAIRNNTVYVHHAVDLVAFSYSADYNSIKIHHRERNVFPEIISPDGFDPSYYGVPEEFIVLGYQLEN